MHIDQWLSALSSLVGAVIGAGAVLLAQAMHWRRSRKADSERERKLAVEEVLVQAQAVDLRAHQMGLLAANVGSLNGLAARLLGSITPVDYASMFEKLSIDANALTRAAAQVWLFADDETVRLANAVVLAATDVVEAHTSPKGGWLHNQVRVAVSGRIARDEERVAQARRALAHARRDLADHTRKILNLPPIDLFALPARVED